MRFQPFGVSQAARAEVPLDESKTLIHPPEMAFDGVKACHDPAVRRGRGPVGVVVRVVRLVAEQDPDQVVVRPVQRAGHRGQGGVLDAAGVPAVLELPQGGHGHPGRGREGLLSDAAGGHAGVERVGDGLPVLTLNPAACRVRRDAVLVCHLSKIAVGQTAVDISTGRGMDFIRGAYT